MFFFFKQKTAYELRISDWSSDVCSSDLVRKVESRGFDARADGGAPDASRPRPRKLATFAKLVGRSARPRLRCRMDARSRYAAPHMVRRLSGAGRDRKSTRLNSSH